MQYGYFDDERREYVITRPDTPRSWTNYLGSTEYGAIITNNAGGYSFLKSAAAGRFTRLRFNAVPMDQPGRYIYIRDNADGAYWSNAWQPVGKPLDEYRSVCRHGTAYTLIDSEYRGIRCETCYFVPLGQQFEYWTVAVTNNGNEPRDLSLFTYVEFASEYNAIADLIELQYSMCTVRCDMVDGMVDHIICNDLPLSALGRPPQRLHTYLAAAGADIVGYDTDREAFIGPYRTYANPRVVEDGACKGSLAWGDNACGSLQLSVPLDPGETRHVVVMLGVGTADSEGRRIRGEYGHHRRAAQELQRLKEYWHNRLGKLAVTTPDDDFNHMINVWNPYNCLITYTWSRAASLVYAGERDGLGFRDTVQDILGVLPAIADQAGERLELMLTGQYSSGGAKPVVRPFDHQPGAYPLPDDYDYRSDDCLWFFNTVPAYVKETGDLDFFHRVLPYADGGSGTVLEHLRKALEFNLNRLGAHGLPVVMNADWNDCLGLGKDGESVMVAFQLRYGLLQYAEICQRFGKAGEAQWASARLSDLDRAINEHCWDGRWYLRAFRDGRVPIGAAANEQGRIFLNAQTWAVISAAADAARSHQAMESVHAMLATEFGLMMCTPGFTKLDETAAANILGNPGIKENAGIFSHTQGWAVMAEAILGNADRAYAYFRSYLPAAYNDRADLRECEPYVYCQSTHSAFSRKFGASRLPWLTGAVAWSYHAATEYILGIRPDYDGLRIAPCLPSAWPEITVVRQFRGRRFDIHIQNGAKGVGVTSLDVNGVRMPDNLIPAAEFQARNRVTVQMR